MTVLLLVDGRVHRVVDDDVHAAPEIRRLKDRGKVPQVLSTHRHTCPMFSVGPHSVPQMVGPCEGCVAEHHLLAYLLRYVRGLNNAITNIPGAT